MTKDAKIPRELERAGALCLAFANTGAPVLDNRRRDRRRPAALRLDSYDEVVTWMQRMGALGTVEGKALRRLAAERPEEAVAVVAGAGELRAAMGRVFTAVALGKEPRASDLDVVNRALRVRWVVPAADGYRRDWGDGTEALDRVLWPVAQSAAELLCSERRLKVGQCAAKGCPRLFIHANRRRLWCDASICGSRARGRRFHELRRQARKQRGPVSIGSISRNLDERVEAGRQRLERKQEAAARVRRARSRKAGEPGSGRSDPR